MADEPDARRLRVALTDASGRSVRAGGLGAWLRGVAPARTRGALTIALVGDATMRRLNREFAGKDKVTDVLSFPAFAPAPCASGASAGKPDRRPGGSQPPWPAEARRAKAAHLGDIVIATGAARRQAREAGHAYGRELRVLALHGLLHLLGYDHETDSGEMARVEARLRRRGGLTQGVIERARLV
jgi:probable rRNA maturation factor